MNKRTIVAALLVLAVALGGLFSYRDYQYRELHGRITEVSLFTWDQEVDAAKDNMPVLVYFYKSSQNNDQERAAVAKFAWNNAGKVKVVAVDVSHVENFPVAVAHGAARVPAFSLISKEREVTGSAGVFSNEHDLDRLVEQLRANP